MDLEKLWGALPDNRFFRLLRSLVERYFDHRVGRRAAALTYYLIFIIFPLLSLASSVLSLLQLPPISVTSDLRNFLPGEVIDIINSFLENINNTPASGLFWASAGLVLYFTVRAVDYLIFCIGETGGRRVRRSPWQHGLVVAIFTVSLPLALLSAFVLLVVGESFLLFLSGFIPITIRGISLWASLRFLILAAILFVVLCLLYWLGPGVRVPLRTVIPGAVAALASWLMFSLGFSFYVENMGNYSVVYGSIGAVIVLLLWLYFTSLTLLMGAEFNQALQDARRRNKRGHRGNGN